MKINKVNLQVFSIMFTHKIYPETNRKVVNIIRGIHGLVSEAERAREEAGIICEEMDEKWLNTFSLSLSVLSEIPVERQPYFRVLMEKTLKEMEDQEAYYKATTLADMIKL